MNEQAKTDTDLGYDEYFESERQKLGWGDLVVARVTVEHKGLYKVRNTEKSYLAHVTGKQMFEATSREDFPAVGDWVVVSEADAEQAVINGILPRRTIVKRKSNGGRGIQVIATNIDVALVVESVNRDFNLNRFERYFAIAEDSGITPAIILNKIDLISEEELEAIKIQIKERFGDIDLILTSIVTDEGLAELKKYIQPGQTYCFLGSSGVGKSSLINKLLGGGVIKTEDIGSKNDRGKHATTTREMYFLENGGIVIDNPGMREVGMTNVDEGIDNLFDEITRLAEQCKFGDCSHTSEPGCEVLAALKAGLLDEGKYNNYISLKKETDFYELTELEKREKDKQFGKFINKAKKDIKKFKY